MSVFSDFVKLAAPLVATVSPEPISRATAQAITVNEQRKQASYQRNLARDQQIAMRTQNMFIPSDISQGSTTSNRPLSSVTNNGSFSSGFGNFVSDLGSNIINPVANLFNSASGFFGNNRVDQNAVNTIGNMGAQETQGSGSAGRQVQTAGLGNIFGPISKLIKNPIGAIGTGIVGGLLGDSFLTPSTGMRVTRKMKSQARMVLNMTNGNLGAASDILGIDQNTLVMILLKRFRNDGPVVTKAALRKTKTTVRRLKSMCDMYDSLRPTATRRKTPMRRASTTLISNK